MKEAKKTTFLDHILNGIGYMLPCVVAGGSDFKVLDVSPMLQAGACTNLSPDVSMRFSFE